MQSSPNFAALASSSFYLLCRTRTGANYNHGGSDALVTNSIPDLVFSADNVLRREIIVSTHLLNNYNNKSGDRSEDIPWHTLWKAQS